MPTLTVSCVNSQPCAVWPAAANQLLSASNAPNVSQPYTFVDYRKHTASGVQSVVLFNGVVQTSHGNSSNTTGVYCGQTSALQTATENNFHSIIEVGNGSSTITGIDGTSFTGLNCGTNATGGGGVLYIGSNGSGSQVWSGSFTELGFWASGFSTANITSMNTNQAAFW